MRRLVWPLVALAGATSVAASSAAGPRSASLVIRHQTHGCHSWSLDHGAFRPAQSVHLARGGTLTVVNTDVMPQTLVEKSGPTVRETGSATLGRMGASVTVTFTKAGTYHFATKAGEDYPGIKAPTVGEDNNLTLTVLVS